LGETKRGGQKGKLSGVEKIMVNGGPEWEREGQITKKGPTAPGPKRIQKEKMTRQNR